MAQPDQPVPETPVVATPDDPPAHPRVAVITPTLGHPHLSKCLASVQAQALPNVVHYVVVDGPERAAEVEGMVDVARQSGRVPIHVMVLPHNIGAGGWCGHRVYGAMPWLVDAEYVAYLDDDNEMDPDHLASLAQCVKDTAGAHWAHSLRRIVDADGTDLCPDNCESLGGLCHTVCAQGDRLIDTSCYFLERLLAIAVSPAWNFRTRSANGLEADRQVCSVLLGLPHACTRRHTLKYRTGSTNTSVTADFFVKGNAELGYDFAAFPDLYVFHFCPEVTARFIECRRDRDRSYALDEWQMTLLRGLDGVPGAPGQVPGAPGEGRFNLLDGYACMDHIPRGATVLVTMCMDQDVPWDFLAKRSDLRRVAYTLESPNIRHAAQWDPVRLAKHFDCVMTYWQPLLDDPRVTSVFCPHNTHHLDFADPADRAQLRDNRGQGTSCAMVLERRDLGGFYAVPNTDVVLTCLDPLREHLVKDLTDVTVFGMGWDEAAARNPGIKVGHTLHRSQDPRHAVDILEEFSFAIIVENCDAEGYASEKLYDALMAGAIPLYYGSVPPQLGIPEGPETGVYLDLRRRLGPDDPRASAKLQEFLDGLGEEAIEAWKARVAALREAILCQVDVRSFAAAFHRALATLTA